MFSRRAFAAFGLALFALGAAHQPASSQEQIYPVPTTTIYAGDVISAGMMKARSYPAGARFRVLMVENPKSVVGKVARRTLPPGEPIPLNALEDHRLVSRGVPTTIIFEEGGLSIVGIGTPMDNGTAGQMIQVKNMDSGRIIVGRVDPEGRIRIGVN
jgi:flagella basal body P-ring formation protein FlgA